MVDNGEAAFCDNDSICILAPGINAYNHKKYIKERNGKIWEVFKGYAAIIGVAAAIVSIAISITTINSKTNQLKQIESRLNKIESVKTK